MVGLNFVNEGEAALFHQAVNNKLQEKHERKQSSKSLPRTCLYYMYMYI